MLIRILTQGHKAKDKNEGIGKMRNLLGTLYLLLLAKIQNLRYNNKSPSQDYKLAIKE